MSLRLVQLFRFDSEGESLRVSIVAIDGQMTAPEGVVNE